MFELLSTEQDYYHRLTEDERRIYVATQEQLAAIASCNDYTVLAFVRIAQLMNELHARHTCYNNITDYLYELPNATEEQQKHYNTVYDINNTLFTASLTIGGFSAVYELDCMDECEALYEYLATIKKSRFDILCDNFDVSLLIEILVKSNCY